MSRFSKIRFVSSDTPDAVVSAKRLIEIYGQATAEDANVVVALGGDGFMLQTIHENFASGLPIYGMNKGTIGFLMNGYDESGLIDRLEEAHSTVINPLKMTAKDAAGHSYTSLAINEVSLLRQRYQAAKLNISIDGHLRMDGLVCDGVLVSTPAGSTAYNFSAHGPILPIDAQLMALTPVSPFRPRRWRGALLPQRVQVLIEVMEPEKRPVNAVADHFEVKSVLTVHVEQDITHEATLLFDPHHTWNERILAEQFSH